MFFSLQNHKTESTTTIMQCIVSKKKIVSYIIFCVYMIYIITLHDNEKTIRTKRIIGL